MFAKWHIKLATAIEPAESVEASPIEIIEQLRGFCALRAAIIDQQVEAFAVSIKTLFFILHLDRDIEAPLQVLVKIYQVRIDVIQQGAIRPQPQ